MTIVKGVFDDSLTLDDVEPKHLGYLLERVTKRMRRDLGRHDEELGGRERFAPLTPSYFRLLSLIPAEGARITDLARLADMTKQALGQFVGVLEQHGYVESTGHPSDRRVRMVARTPRGDEVCDVVAELSRRLHAQWRDDIGGQRWDAFIEVLTELAVGWEQPRVDR
ncbi:MAG: MarR family transcriptional regulator [Propionibacteriales bacterium]|nr:MarR family transcriptional regulator [Propionibacteriales bacterium]